MRPRAPWSRRLAALALALLAGPLFAAPTEVPVVDAPVGAGNVGAAPSVSAAPLATALSVSAAPGVAAPLPVLAPAAAAPSALPAAAAPSAAPAAVAPASRFAAPASGPVFGRRVSPPAAAPEGRAAASEGRAAALAATPASGEEDWARSSALFDLAAERDGDAAAAVAAGLPANDAGKALLRLRRAGEGGAAGPGAIAGIADARWAGPAGHGNSGETAKVLIDGKTWFLKKLGRSPDPGIAALPSETRALNEAGLAAVLRGDPQLSRSFSVPGRVSLLRDGRDVFVLSEGLPSVGDGESRRQDLSAIQRADAAIVQLALGLGDMHGGDVLPLGGGRFGLVDFEKLSRAPLAAATAREIDEQVMMKNFPLVDRLSENDPAVYKERFEAWLADYRAGGRERMDRALAGAGWSRPSREVYLSAVDRNAETYPERLQPYLDYANGWHRRIREARAAQAARDAAPKRRGLLDRLLDRR